MQSIKFGVCVGATSYLSLVVITWLLCIASALMVVSVTHGVRGNIGKLEQLRLEAAELKVQWGQYLLEQSTLASFSRVEKQARKKLGMQTPSSKQIILVDEE